MGYLKPVRFTLRKYKMRIFGDGYSGEGKRIYERENQIHE
jgi:hypothetical protein